VCDELNCDTQVFPLAVKLLDMTLSTVSVSINQLQLLGATCMHIASKLRSTNIISTTQCTYYSDHSFTTRAVNVRIKNRTQNSDLLKAVCRYNKLLQAIETCS